MKMPPKKWMVRGGILIAVVAVAAIAWTLMRPSGLPDGIVGSNGRIEATEIDVSAKSAGRIKEITVDEGDFVQAGDVVARMDTDVLEANRAEAEAQLAKATADIETAQTQVAQRRSERAAALADLRQREAQLAAARRRLARSETLAREGAAPMQERDDDRAEVEGASAAVEAARAQLAAVDATVTTAQSQVVGARSSADAARATIQRIKADIGDSALRAPRAGRVQYRVAQPGEVVAAGGRILNLVDLTDVYMTVFLPTEAAGRVALGSEVRIVLDAAPDTFIPAKVSFVADVAQFTPKTVETESEREKLMFRVRAQIDPAVLRRNAARVKTGLPGMAYIRIDPKVAWPDTQALRAGR